MANKKWLIDANAFHKELYERPLDFLDVGGDFGYFDETIESVLNEQPTVDAVEVVHGRCVYVRDDELIDHYECSVCHKYIPQEYTYWHYCPNCGAKMDGDGDG